MKLGSFLKATIKFWKTAYLGNVQIVFLYLLNLMFQTFAVVLSGYRVLASTQTSNRAPTTSTSTTRVNVIGFVVNLPMLPTSQIQRKHANIQT